MIDKYIIRTLKKHIISLESNFIIFIRAILSVCLTIISVSTIESKYTAILIF